MTPDVILAARPALIAVIGPTAAGKSALALEFARKLGGEILCVDSMTVYRGLDIGTAKPTSDERQEIPHHLLDIVDPDQPFSTAQFVARADEMIADARRRDVPLIAVGGTPLYFKALFEGMFEGPGADAGLRERLAAQPNAVLHARLAEVDPAAAARIHANDQRRLIRALEVYELTGKPITAHQQEWGSGTHRHAAVWVGVTREKEVLNRRINARVKQMIAAGWVDEVRNVLAQYGTLSNTAGEATGYAELIAHVQGKNSLEDAIEQIKIGTRQLARRQMKWFRRFENVHWIAANDGGSTA